MSFIEKKMMMLIFMQIDFLAISCKSQKVQHPIMIPTQPRSSPHPDVLELYRDAGMSSKVTPLLVLHWSALLHIFNDQATTSCADASLWMPFMFHPGPLRWKFCSCWRPSGNLHALRSLMRDPLHSYWTNDKLTVHLIWLILSYFSCVLRHRRIQQSIRSILDRRIKITDNEDVHFYKNSKFYKSRSIYISLISTFNIFHKIYSQFFLDLKFDLIINLIFPDDIKSEICEKNKEAPQKCTEIIKSNIFNKNYGSPLGLK